MSPDENSTENGSLGLPSEILVEIFCYCLPSDNIRLSKPPQLLTPFTLARVCSLWRNLVLSSARLWNRIVLGRHGSDSAKEMKVFGFWLERAGPEIPLDILLDPQEDNVLQVLLDQEASEKYERDTIALMQRFCASTHRMCSLDLEVLDAGVLEPLYAILGSTSGPRTAPLLEELQLTSVHLGRGSDKCVLSNIAYACPRLRSVKLMTPTVLPGGMVLNNMRTLELRFCTAVSHAMAWIDVCRNLEHLKIQLFSRPDEEDPEIDELAELGNDVFEVVAEDTIDDEGWLIVNRPRPEAERRARTVNLALGKKVRWLNHLTYLEIQGFSSAASIGALLDSLATPALRCLKVSSHVSYLDLGTARQCHVPLLLHRSNPPLEELEVAGSRMNVDDIRTCLMSTPHLKRFSAGMREELDTLLEALTISRPNDSSLVADRSGCAKGSTQQSTQYYSANTSLCPQLEVLDVSSVTFSIDVLASMVSSRFTTRNSVYSRSEEIDGVDVASLKQLIVNTKISQEVTEHPVIAECVAQGLTLKEESDKPVSFRVED